MSISVKVFRRGKEIVVAACDAELLDSFVDDQHILRVNGGFYRGHMLSIEEAIEKVRLGTNVNLLGKRIISCAIKAGLIHPEAVTYISGIPHALIVKI
jgi:hypothetical protein